MPVDVFGRTDFAKDSTHVISRGINMKQANGTFLRRDGGNAAASDIDLDSHKLTNIADSTNDKDAANKEYVDSNAGTNKVSKSGDYMTGNLYMKIDTDTIRLLGCTDLNPGTGFSIPLGNYQNQLQFQKTDLGQEQSPVTLEMTYGLLVRTYNDNICHIGFRDNPPTICIYKDIEMNSNRILFLTNPTHPHEAVSKNYMDRKFDTVISEL